MIVHEFEKADNYITYLFWLGIATPCVLVFAFILVVLTSTRKSDSGVRTQKYEVMN